jgi:hypothetical protein
MRTSFHHQSEAQPPNGPLTAATSPDTPSTCPASQSRLCPEQASRSSMARCRFPASDALDRASPDAERLGHLQDTHALRKLLSHLLFGRAVYLRPAELHALSDGAPEACFDPLANHGPLKFSEGASYLENDLPIGVVVSMPCWSRYRSTPHASRCWIVSSKSISERPKRSIAHAMTISNFRRHNAGPLWGAFSGRHRTADPRPGPATSLDAGPSTSLRRERGSLQNGGPAGDLRLD